MSATNATTYYELPVFIATDKPAWLTDWNGAMSAIDTAIKEALTAGENAQTTANTATTSIATINDSLTTINTSLTTLTSTVTGLVGSVNTINSLIGNGEPTTSDKTLIGAINEIYGMITGGGGGAEIQAINVVYDNTTSGLTATNVQSAIDEVNGKISTPEADDVAYDNTTSGLSATNVQDAIDEIAQGGSGSGSVDYSTTEHKIGKWIDDSDLYEITISVGPLPNATSKAVATGVTNIDKVIYIKGYASDGNFYMSLPTANPTSSYAIDVFYKVADNTLNIVATTDFSAYTDAYVTIRYTKSA